MGECIFDTKNARDSRALRQALDPGQCFWLSSLALCCYAPSAILRKKLSGPPLDQILDPLLVIPALFLVGKFSFEIIVRTQMKFCCLLKIFKYNEVDSITSKLRNGSIDGIIFVELGLIY